MYITIRTLDGREIVWRSDQINWFSTRHNVKSNIYMSVRRKDAPVVEEGYITINLDHVVLIREASKEEIESVME